MKPRRMSVLAALLLGAALLVIFDRPREPALVEAVVAAAPARRAQARLAHESAAPVAVAAGEVPDLFAAAPAPTPEQGQGAAAPAGGGEDGPAPPFGLAGFQVEDGVRSAVLLRDDGVLLARAGAVLEGRYRVLAVQQEAVQIRDQHTGVDIRVGFGTNQ